MTNDKDFHYNSSYLPTSFLEHTTVDSKNKKKKRNTSNSHQSNCEKKESKRKVVNGGDTQIHDQDR